MAKKPIKSWEETKALVAMGKGYIKMKQAEKEKINKELSQRLTEIEGNILSLDSIVQIRNGWIDLESVLVHHGNHEGEQLVASLREKALAHLNELGHCHPLPETHAERKEAWSRAKPTINRLRRRIREEEKASLNQKLLQEWISTYELRNDISFKEAQAVAMADGWSEDLQVIRDVFLDKNIWDQIIERMPPRSQQYSRERLRTNTGIAQIGIRRGKFFVELDLTPKRGHDTILQIFGLDKGHVANLNKAAMETFVLRGYLPRDVKHNKQQVVPDPINDDGSPFGFIYFIRNQSLYKIGITTNLLRRLNELRPDEVLNVARCANYQVLEKELHRLFAMKRVAQTEYFRLDESEILQVHKTLQDGILYA
jgi:hypothetical protein